MTIVLQHQFWDLTVSEERFEVELSFDNIPEKLVIPFNAVKGFLDPAVQFGLQFETVSAEARSRRRPKPKGCKPRKAGTANPEPEAAADRGAQGRLPRFVPQKVMSAAMLRDLRSLLVSPVSARSCAGPDRRGLRPALGRRSR